MLAGASVSVQNCCLQITGRGWEEAMALRIGQAYQSATTGHLRGLAPPA
jgi:Asp-tRNA(Asn)/Glu-tRNA(Gln) amidotransferase A subunit family amidase